MIQESTLAQNIPGSPVITTGGGGSWWSGAGNFLSSAVASYAQYEAIRAARNPQITYLEKAYENPLPTGAAVEIEEGKQQPGETAVKDNVDVMGLSVPRAAAYIGGGLLALIIVKKAGIL